MSLWEILFDEEDLSKWCVDFLLTNNKRFYFEIRDYITDQGDILEVFKTFGDDLYLANRLEDRRFINWYKKEKYNGRL